MQHQYFFLGIIFINWQYQDQIWTQPVAQGRGWGSAVASPLHIAPHRCLRQQRYFILFSDCIQLLKIQSQSNALKNKRKTLEVFHSYKLAEQNFWNFINVIKCYCAIFAQHVYCGNQFIWFVIITFHSIPNNLKFYM